MILFSNTRAWEMSLDCVAKKKFFAAVAFINEMLIYEPSGPNRAFLEKTAETYQRLEVN